MKKYALFCIMLLMGIIFNVPGFSVEDISAEKLTSNLSLNNPVLPVPEVAKSTEDSRLCIESPAIDCENDSIIEKQIEEDLKYGNLPLYFIKNEGQVDARALYYAKASGYTLWVTKEGLVFDAVKHAEKENDAGSKPVRDKNIHTETMRNVHRLVFQNTNPELEITAVDTTSHKVNYFIGSNKSNWKTDISSSKGILYKNLYTNIDLKIYGSESRIEYDFIVKPGADPDLIQFDYTGVEGTHIDDQGCICIRTKLGEYFHDKPKSYQIIDSKLITVESQFSCVGEHGFRLETGTYNNNYAMIIDPVVSIAYSTYLGKNVSEEGHDIAVESGYAYITGFTWSTDFPTKNAFQKTNAGNFDAFVSKLNTGGNELIYSTYIGGNDYDGGGSIAVESGYAYITGFTGSTDFPTKNAFQKTYAGGSDAFVTKLDAGGNILLYSTYLGGNLLDDSYGIAVESGYAYITGETSNTNFPTKNAFQKTNAGNYDAFVTKLDAGGNILLYSTYLGGNGYDCGYGIAVESGYAYITGETYNTDFPTKNAFQKTHAGGFNDAFVTKLNAGGNTPLYSTYLGGNENDVGNGIAVESGYAYITGLTRSTDFPTKNAFQKTNTGNYDAFVSKLNIGGNELIYSTNLGGKNDDGGNGIAIESGYAYITGFTGSTDFPTENAFQKTNAGNYDAIVSKLNAGGNELIYSTYLGGKNDDVGDGIAVESGYAYITGYTDSTDFPTKKAFQKTNAGNYDAFVSRLSLGPWTGFKLCYGLNLVSVPYIDLSLDTASELRAAVCSGDADVIWKFNCATNSFDSWTFLDPGDGWEVTPGLPFWVNITKASGCDWHYSGLPAIGWSYTLCTGLNLVALPEYSTGITMASDLMADIPGCVGVWRYTKEVSCSNPAGWGGYFNISLPADDYLLQNWHSYWVTVTAGTTWTPPAP